MTTLESIAVGVLVLVFATIVLWAIHRLNPSDLHDKP